MPPKSSATPKKAPAKPSLADLAVKPRAEPMQAAPSDGRASEDRKLITLRLTYAQRRHLQRIAFDSETTLQELIYEAVDKSLKERGLPGLDSVKG